MPQMDIQLDSIDVARGRLADEVQKLENQGAQIQEIRYPGWATAALGIKRDGTVRNFVRRLGMIGAKEPAHAATQRTSYS
jgi:hypothetical protein